MSYQVVSAAAARRDMSRVPPRIAPAIIEFVYGDLSANPRRVGKSLDRKLMGSFSARCGPYRILYDIDPNTETIEILRVDHRSDIYRRR